jgi:hypothetical protein
MFLTHSQYVKYPQLTHRPLQNRQRIPYSGIARVRGTGLNIVDHHQQG